MNETLNFRKKISLIIFLFVSSFGLSQNKSNLYNEIIHHKESGDFNEKQINLITTYSKTANRGVQSTVMNIKKSTIQNIISKNKKFITIQLPLDNSKLYFINLKKRNVFDEEFSDVVQNNNSSKQETLNKAVSLSYTGLIVGEETNSLVSIVFYNNVLGCTIFLGDKVFSLTQIDSNDNYSLHEQKIDDNVFPLTCGVSDNDNISLNKAIENKLGQSTIPKCVKLHFEITKNLNIEWGGVEQTIVKFMTLFNLVQSKFANEGITVRLSYLKIWNTDDPYYQSWVGSPGLVGSYQDLGMQSFQNLGGTINGNIGILLNTFSSKFLGLAGGIPCSNQGFNVNRIYPNFDSENVKTIMHEIGHTLGSNHTHWCGWIGGAIDNCSPTEGGCPLGPAPVNGGTIMSYCGSPNIVNNGFGPQPNAIIVNTVANSSCITSCDSSLSCEDNIVNAGTINNTSPTSFTVGWTSSYAVKVYFKEVGTSSFTLLNTVQQPNNSYVINYTPSTNCTIQKFEIKLVSVCPNGDGKPTVVVFSPQGHLKPYVDQNQNNFCNIYNPTIANLQVTGQNLKWYATETGGVVLPTSQSIPLNVSITYFVSQTVNGCESERARLDAYINNVSTPVGPTAYQFECETLKASDLYSISSLYSSSNSTLRWYTSELGTSTLVNSSMNLTNNTLYYAANISYDPYYCVSVRLPVFITTNTSGYTIPFTETFDYPFNCQLGYTTGGVANSGSLINNVLQIFNDNSNITDDYVVTKKMYLTAGKNYYISFKVKKMVDNQNATVQSRIFTTGYNYSLGTFSIVSTDYSIINYTIKPDVSGFYNIRFNLSAAQSDGVYIDDLTVNTSLSTSDTELVLFSIFPNPAKSIVNVSANNGVINLINVYDLLGRLLKSQKGNHGNEQVNIQNLPNAIYLLEIKTDKAIKTVKIIKQ